MTIEDIDRWEINEAFAGQAVACVKDLGLDVEKVNVNGGAVGLGHPLAATGTRLVLTLAHELETLWWQVWSCNCLYWWRSRNCNGN